MTEIRRYHPRYLQAIADLIHQTIRFSYPAIFSHTVVEYFIQYHSIAEIRRRAEEGEFFILFEDEKLIACGFLLHNEMGGLYVHPQWQKKGYGSKMAKHIIQIARQKKLNSVWLDATPIAKSLYDKLGFETIEKAFIWVGDEPLEYYSMELNLIKYNGFI